MHLGSTHCKILCIQCTVLRTELGPIKCHKSGFYSNFWHTAWSHKELQRSVASIFSPKPASCKKRAPPIWLCVLNERYWENWTTSWCLALEVGRAELAWLLETRALVGMFSSPRCTRLRRYVLSLCWYKGAGWSPSQTQPTPARIAFSITARVLKVIRAGVGWVWLARLGAGHLR